MKKNPGRKERRMLMFSEKRSEGRERMRKHSGLKQGIRKKKKG